MARLIVFGIIFLLIGLPIIGIIKKIAGACGTSWFKTALCIFCCVVGFCVYTDYTHKGDFQIIIVDSFMLIALVAASPWIIILARKTIAMFYIWAVGGLLTSDDYNQDNG